MSKADLFSRYSQLYQKSTIRQVVPDGVFVGQLADTPTYGLDVGVFFKQKGIKEPRQIYFQEPIPTEVAKKDGFLEGDVGGAGQSAQQPLSFILKNKTRCQLR